MQILVLGGEGYLAILVPNFLTLEPSSRAA